MLEKSTFFPYSAQHRLEDGSHVAPEALGFSFFTFSAHFCSVSALVTSLSPQKYPEEHVPEVSPTTNVHFQGRELAKIRKWDKCKKTHQTRAGLE